MLVTMTGKMKLVSENDELKFDQKNRRKDVNNKQSLKQS